MPRCARVKSQDSIFHIMIRSISEINLFNDDEDKRMYYYLIKKYIKKYQFKVYAYCLMDNHGHLMIDANGSDISRVMHGINFSYANYYNRKYKRHGHLFQDRFKSKIVDKEEYFITLSAYIHNNPKDVKNYTIVGYPYSSLKEYMNETNEFEILDKSFLRELLNLNKRENKKAYLSLVQKCFDAKDSLDIEFEEEQSEYRSERKILPRAYTPKAVIRFVTNYVKADENSIHMKYRKKWTEVRALACFLMSCFCNMKQKDICEVLGNITQSTVSRLSSLGQNIAFDDEVQKKIIDDFIKMA